MGSPLRYPYPMAEQTGWQGERLTIGLLGGGTVGAAVARGLATMAGNRPAIASPLRLSDSLPDAGSEPPLLGQNTDEVLGAMLGHDAASIADLKARGIL